MVTGDYLPILSVLFGDKGQSMTQFRESESSRVIWSHKMCSDQPVLWRLLTSQNCGAVQHLLCSVGQCGGNARDHGLLRAVREGSELWLCFT